MGSFIPRENSKASIQWVVLYIYINKNIAEWSEDVYYWTMIIGIYNWYKLFNYQFDSFVSRLVNKEVGGGGSSKLTSSLNNYE